MNTKYTIYYYFSVINPLEDEPIVIRVLDCKYSSAFNKVVNNVECIDQITYVGSHFVDEELFYPSQFFSLLGNVIPGYHRSIEVCPAIVH